MIWPWYFITDVFICVLAVGVVCWAWPKLSSIERFESCLTAGLVMPLQIINEYLSLFTFKAWTFSFEHNYFIGVSIFSIPLEEFLFWFAFAWFIPFAYSGLTVYFKERSDVIGGAR